MDTPPQYYVQLTARAREHNAQRRQRQRERQQERQRQQAQTRPDNSAWSWSTAVVLLFAAAVLVLALKMTWPTPSSPPPGFEGAPKFPKQPESTRAPKYMLMRRERAHPCPQAIDATAEFNSLAKMSQALAELAVADVTEVVLRAGREGILSKLTEPKLQDAVRTLPFIPENLQRVGEKARVAGEMGRLISSMFAHLLVVVEDWAVATPTNADKTRQQLEGVIFRVKDDMDAVVRLLASSMLDAELKKAIGTLNDWAELLAECCAGLKATHSGWASTLISSARQVASSAVWFFKGQQIDDGQMTPLQGELCALLELKKQIQRLARQPSQAVAALAAYRRELESNLVAHLAGGELPHGDWTRLDTLWQWAAAAEQDKVLTHVFNNYVRLLKELETMQLAVH